MNNNEIAEQARKTAEGLIETIRATRAGDNATLAILIRTFHTVSDIHLKAVGRALRVNANWELEEV